MNRKKFSIENGDKHVIAGKVYFGRNPVYQQMTNPLTRVTDFIKVKKGVPFVCMGTVADYEMSIDAGSSN